MLYVSNGKEDYKKRLELKEEGEAATIFTYKRGGCYTFAGTADTFTTQTEDIVPLLPIFFGKSSVQHHRAQQLLVYG